VWLWDHDPFGNGTPSGTFSYNLRFPGQFYDQNAKLYYNYLRDYDPNAGRYIESDPIGLLGSTNTYTYADGNPINFTDPLGLAVYVGEHGAAFPSDPFQHTAIVLQPDNPADFNFSNNTSTLGGQPGGSWWTSWSIFGNLRSSPDNPGDSPGTPCQPGPLKNLTLVPTPPGMTDTQFINSLINAADSYKNNLPYGLFPNPYGYGYNSNSYTAGVIIKAGGTPPTLLGSQPGYGKPIPLP
jgi:RHS repeat-associated protein